MSTPAVSSATLLNLFFQASLRALVRAEVLERVPPRFIGTGQEVWKTFCNELDTADLLILCIQDAAANMPIPFNPHHWLPFKANNDSTRMDIPAWSGLQAEPASVESWLPEAIEKASQPLDDYVLEQSTLLGISRPAPQLLAKLPTPQRHERWLELPGTAGWVAYTLCTRTNEDLYLWDNFTILCNSPQEIILAGLIAWELGAPPNIELPIILDDTDLTNALKAGQTYHAVVGSRALHGHRDLRLLHFENRHPLWL